MLRQFVALIALISFILAPGSTRGSSISFRRYEARSTHALGTEAQGKGSRFSSLSNGHLYQAENRLRGVASHLPSFNSGGHLVGEAQLTRELGYSPRELDVHHSRLPAPQLYTGLVSLRNLNPKLFDRLHCPLLVEVLKNPLAMERDAALLAAHPHAFFRYRPFLTRIVEGHEVVNPPVPPITTPKNPVPPKHHPGGPIAVPAPPSGVLLSLGAACILCVMRYRKMTPRLSYRKIRN